jgi:hypothetical protein
MADLKPSIWKKTASRPMRSLPDKPSANTRGRERKELRLADIKEMFLQITRDHD